MAQQMIYTPHEEAALMKEVWTPDMADDPYRFVMFAFPWGKPNTPLEHFTGPRSWQKDILTSIRDHIAKNRGKQVEGISMEALRSAVSSGRGIGKSALVSWLVIWMISTRIGSTTIVSANSEAQLRSVTWAELTKWVAMTINSHWFEVSATRLFPAKWLSDLVETDLKKGTRYWAAEGKLWSEENPDSYAGVHNHDGMMVIFDESSGIPSSIWDVAAGYFTEPVLDRYWFAFSNPRRSEGYFFECFHGKRTYWMGKKIDSRTVEGTDRNIYDQIIEEHGEDSYQARVEVMGEFPLQGDSQFIEAHLVEEAIKRPRYDDESAPLVLGVDVARFGSDKTCLALRKGRDLVILKKYSGLDTMQVVGKVIEMIDRHSPDLTVIDEGGLGAGVLDRLQEQKYKVRGVNFGSKADASAYANKRAEMWGAMREWLAKASIGSSDNNSKRHDADLKDDLTGPQYKLDSQGRTLLEAKADMKKRGLHSPDCFVAGTKVATLRGEVPIEQVIVGDYAVTPFGCSEVIATYEALADSITTITFNDGQRLSGKGSHRLFTFDSGWVRMDAISLTNEIESNNLWGRLAWIIREALFTRKKPSFFKQQVDTISRGERISRSDFYTEGFTRNILGRSLMAMQSIIKMAIGQTTPQTILTACQMQSTVGSTCWNSWGIKTSGQPHLLPLTGGKKLQEVGTVAKRGFNGMSNTVSAHGRKESHTMPFALPAEVATRPTSQVGQVFAQTPAPNDCATSSIKQRMGFAFGVARSLFSTNIASNHVAPVSVQTENAQAMTYNLTLREDNVYYANGVLVENCADAIAVSFAYPVGRKGSNRPMKDRKMKNYNAMIQQNSGWMA